MILVDTSVWIDHLRTGDAGLARSLERAEVLCHPWVTGELALGDLRDRKEVIELLTNLPQATSATADEVLAFVERAELYGRGIGYADAQLLAGVQLMPGATLWTRDRHLAEAAARQGTAYRADR